MTKEEAKKALFKGEKITHKYFLSSEWIKLKSNNSDRIIDEMGVIIPPESFFDVRGTDIWDEGWEIYVEPK